MGEWHVDRVGGTWGGWVVLGVGGWYVGWVGGTWGGGGVGWVARGFNGCKLLLNLHFSHYCSHYIHLNLI